MTCEPNKGRKTDNTDNTYFEVTCKYTLINIRLYKSKENLFIEPHLKTQCTIYIQIEIFLSVGEKVSQTL